MQTVNSRKNKNGMKDRILMILLQNQGSFVSGEEISRKWGQQNSSMEAIDSCGRKVLKYNPNQTGAIDYLKYRIR